MPAKRFNFSVVDSWTDQVVAFSAEALTLDAALKLGLAAAASELLAGKLYGPFHAQGWLRLFRFRIENAKTGEFTAALGQGESILEAWSDVLKGARDTFRPKNDGRSRPNVGLTVLLPAAARDVETKGRAVARPIESFESDETFDQERIRLRLEAERKRLAELNGRPAFGAHSTGSGRPPIAAGKAAA